MGREKIFYPCAEHVEIRNEDFITKDEVNYRLTQGSGSEHGQFRIYEYFTEKHEKYERVEFLKNEYGTGGSSHALPGSDAAHEAHDAKGIRLEKGDAGNPYANVLLNWNVLEKRISELIKADKYLTPEQMEAYVEYRQEKEVEALEKAQEKLEYNLNLECKEAIEKAIAEHFDAYRLSPNIAEAIVKQYGRERVAFLLANTMIQKESDGRFSEDNKVWAKNLVLNSEWKNREFVLTSHPAVLNGFISQARNYIQRQEVLEQEILQTSAATEWKETDSILVLNSFEKENHPSNTEKNLLFSSVIQTENWKKMQTTDDVNQTPSLPSASLQDIAERKAVNFHIKPEVETSSKGFAAKEKFHQNIEAVRTLKIIEAEHRTATPEEQEILAKYAGWGGLSDAFDETKVNWAGEYQELKRLLSSEEYASARESILNAHYTSPVIIQEIYEVIEKMGVSQGTVLEPAMGTGHFLGMLPEQMRQSRLYGVELDAISGRIAKQLYPNANIQISGFEKTDFPNDFFDMAIGNVPFGQYKVSDREYDKYNLSVHDSFLVKSLDKVKANGIAAFITLKSTMDKRNPTARKLMAQRGELTGNPYFKEKMLLDIEVSKLKLLKANHTNQKYRLEDNITQHYPKQIAQLKEEVSNLNADITHYAKNRFPDKESFSMKVGNRLFVEKKEAGAALLEMCKNTKSYTNPVEIGEYQGFSLCVHYRVLSSKFVATLKGKMGHEVELGVDALGNLQRMNNLLDGMTVKLEESKQKLFHVEHQLETAKTEVKKPFAQETELKEKQERLNTLNSLLNIDEKDFRMLAADNPEMETAFNEKNVSYESEDAGSQSIIAENIGYDFRKKTDNFEILHEDKLKISGVPMDIHPIKKEKRGTLQTYFPEAEQYLTQKQKAQEKPKRISIQEKLKEKRAEIQKREEQRLEQKEVRKHKADRHIFL